MAVQVITVAQVPGGWSVTCAYSAAPLMFLRGGDAIRQAWTFAELAGGAGEAAELQIRDGAGGWVAGLAFALPDPTAPRTAPQGRDARSAAYAARSGAMIPRRSVWPNPLL